MFAASKTASVSGGYQISRSLRFNSADSTYLNRTPASASNRRTFTFSAWVKRSFVGTGADNSLLDAYVDNSNRTQVTFGGTANAQLYLVNVVSGTSSTSLGTAAVFRDASAWYHIVYSVDTTQATSTNRVAIYVNGVAQTLSGTYPSQNDQFTINNNTQQTLGVAGYSGLTNYFSGYMTEVNFIDGQALTPSSFGETNAQTGVWQPKAYSGSYGTNGFYLNFSDNSNTTAATLGKDYSGNGNNWTPNNFSVTAGSGNDSLVDSPTSYGTDTGVGGTVRGNYATLNPLTQSSGTASNGNLQYYGSNSWKAIASTFLLPSTGKWFAEVVLLNAPLSGNFSDMWNGFGVIAPSAQSAWSYNSGTSFFISDTGHYSNYSTGSTGNFTGNTTGTVLGLAFDRDTNQITVYQNGVSKATVTVGVTSGSDLYFFNGSYSATYGSMAVNFGQRPFAYTAPSGYKALCTQNLPTPTIGATTATLATSYFTPVTYTGTGANGNAITVGFQPDFTWLKGRSNVQNHGLFDAVRGAGKGLQSNSTSAEYNLTDTLNSFNSNGFTVNNDSTFNGSGYTYVAWNWKANGSGSTNTAGSITSTVSANTTSGFSVVTYTATGSVATIGHGLGVAPKMVILKGRSGATDWFVYHSATGANVGLYLNQTLAGITSANFWNNTAPTSTVFTAGTGVGGSGVTMVAYCFAEVAGYSKFGSYTGNGSADGPFVYCGFRPRYIMVKGSGNSSNWTVIDTARDSYNACKSGLYSNLSAAESDPGPFDILSNGFKIRHTYTDSNGSGIGYIFAAFAEAPLKYSLAR